MKKNLLLLTMAIFAWQCSGDDGSKSTGYFIDAATAGVRYESRATNTGFTGSDGSFQYSPGFDITFYIGDIVLGTTTGANQITPVNLVNGATGADDQTVLNIARLLQTLDSDGDNSNGITITDAAHTKSKNVTVDFTLSDSAFAAQSALVSLVKDVRGSGVSIVSSANAKAHLQASLNTLQGSLAILGTWSDNFGGTHTITATGWTQDYGSPQLDALVEFNNTEKYVIVKKAAADCCNANKFQKVYFTGLNGSSWFFCTVSPFNNDTADAARAISAPDSSSPSTGGCGAFSWTKINSGAN